MQAQPEVQEAAAQLLWQERVDWVAVGQQVRTVAHALVPTGVCPTWVVYLSVSPSSSRIVH